MHIYKRAGISLSPLKRDLVYSRLSRRLRAGQFASFEQYLDYLEGGGHDDEWTAFVNALTTNQTFFFREAHHFKILADHVKRLKLNPVTLWCCAASSGEEPYSIAMTLVELFGSFDAPVKILASDLDTNVLTTAEEGIYPLERVEGLPPEQVKRFFLKGSGKHEGYVRVRPELAQLVSFRKINLVEDRWPVPGPLDGIFCRNVMIYFDKQTQYRILKKFRPLLHPHGLLFAGHSENFFQAKDLFQPLGKTVYKLVQ